MITRIEALNYRCLRSVQQDVPRFAILVGPNASGKSTFLDVVGFIRDMLIRGPEGAVLLDRECNSIQEMSWMRTSDRFELAVELKLPDHLAKIGNSGQETWTHARYEVQVGVDHNTNEISVLEEALWLQPPRSPLPQPQITLFPRDSPSPETLITRHTPSGWRKIVSKVGKSGNDYFQSETGKWNNLFRLGPRKPALANLPEDETKFPRATWAKRFLMERVETLMLDSRAMRRPSSALYGSVTYRPDGSNLPQVVNELADKHPDLLQRWLDHVQTTLDDVAEVKVNTRPEDRARYLVLRYRSGLEVPSWLISDGTLRLLALTLLAYLPGMSGTYLIEEPENGIHPLGIETVYQSLSSVYDAQVLVATHSPMLLGLARPDNILCFARTDAGATDVVKGSDHPSLREWRGELDLSTLYAAGVLG